MIRLAILCFWAVFLPVRFEQLIDNADTFMAESRLTYTLSNLGYHMYLWFSKQILKHAKILLLLVVVCVLCTMWCSSWYNKQYPTSWNNYAFLFPPSVAYFGCNYLNAFIYQASLNGCWVYWPSWQYLIFHLWRSDFFFHSRGKEEKEYLQRAREATAQLPWKPQNHI